MADKSRAAVLLLEDGFFLKGVSVGASGTRSGELCFNTGMTGYQEAFTDPSYKGQILIMTTPHIGNYGTIPYEQESSKVHLSAIVTRSLSRYTARHNAEALIHFLKRHNTMAIEEIDTRALVRRIRSKGAMRAIVSDTCLHIPTLQKQLEKVPSMKGLELASKVSRKQIEILGDPTTARFRIAVLDFGIKQNIVQSLLKRQCLLILFPAQTTLETIMRYEPDAFFLSNGPGDPAAMDYAIQTAKKLLQLKKPTFGICLGHQILALASGAKTYKLPFGHRGLNHPVFNKLRNRGEITSQNHGFAIEKESVSDDIEVTHYNLNDGTIEGLAWKHLPVFSVQYHPEASPGPHDSTYLFDAFIDLIQQRCAQGLQAVAQN